MRSLPAVDVVVVTLNAASLIADCIESIVQQRGVSPRIVSIDGGSTDGTQGVIARYGQWLAYSNSEADSGIYDAMNKGLSRSSSKYVFFLNSDDRFADCNVLADLVGVLDRSPECQMAVGDLIIRSRDGDSYRSFSEVRPSDIGFVTISHQAMLLRRDAFDQIGNFDLKWAICSDLEWQLRYVRSGRMFRYIERPVAVYCADGMSSREHGRRVREVREIVKENYSYWKILRSRFRLAIGRRLGRNKLTQVPAQWQHCLGQMTRTAGKCTTPRTEAEQSSRS